MTKVKVRRLPVHRGPAAWDVILGPGPDPVVLGGNATADFVVIGAGFAGLAAARRLRQLAPGAQVTVLEAGRVAAGAAGRNSGFMIDLPHELTSQDYAGTDGDRALIALNRAAQDFAGHAVADYGINPAFFDRAGKINGAASEGAVARNSSYAAHLDQLGEAYTLLDAAQMQAVTGSAHYHAGLYTPGTVMLQPAGFVRGMAAGLRRDGVTIYEDSPVTGLTPSGRDWQVMTPSGRVTAPRVILTVNGHLESFGFARGRLMHVFLFAAMTPDLTTDQLRSLGGQDRWGITPSDPMGTTLRRIDTAQGGNRIVTRTCAVLRPGMAATQRDVDRAARVMQGKFDVRFPQLRGVGMAHVWAGHLCLSRNGAAVMQQVAPGLFAGCVQNGLGTARGTLTGIGAAELACGTTSEITRYFGAQPMPPRLPIPPFQQLGGNALIRYKEHRAAQE